MRVMDPQTWPPHDVEVRPWRQSIRGGTREDRMLSSVATAVPPFIAGRGYSPAASTVGVVSSTRMPLGSKK